MKKKVGLNVLPATLREKRRYIAFKVRSRKRFKQHQLAAAITQNCLELFGAFGMARIAPKLVAFYPDKQAGILRCERSHVKHAKLCITMLSTVEGHRLVPKIVITSGTIKKAKEALGVEAR
jgi:ribonuclease P/MRP protein subunit POP5